MSWLTCPRCKFRQIPSDHCLSCGEPLGQAAGGPKPLPARSARTRPRRGPLAGAAAAAVLLAALAWLAASGRGRVKSPPAPPAEPSPAPLDLSGRWHAELSRTLGSSPPRPVLKEVVIESDRDGSIVGARVVLTDPGRGGAGAGYRIVRDGPRRLAEAMASISAEPKGAQIATDFVPFPAWIPARQRRWRAIEGERSEEPARYLLVESLETDYLVQAGINESGFLSYAFFSAAWARARGRDILSRVIHPAPGGSLAGFQNLVWDLSGAADFLSLKVRATVSGPEGGRPERLTLTREAGERSP